MGKKILLFASLLLFGCQMVSGISSPELAFPQLPSLAPVSGSPTPTAQPLPTRVSDPAPTSSDTPEPPKTLLDEQMPDREIVAETEHFVFYAQDDYFPVDQDWWLAQSEQIYSYVSQRLEGAEVEDKILIGFLPPDDRTCPVRGFASHNHPPEVIIFASPESSRAYLQGVLAHELGHAIPSEGFPKGMPDDQALTEGLATWASGKYWSNWMKVPSLDALIQNYIQSGVYEPIHKNYDLHGIYPWQKDVGKNCLARRDKIYSEWGSFLGYLIRTYGWDRAHRLFQNPEDIQRDGKIISFPPDYEGIYGKSLNQLEAEWLLTLQ